MANAAKIQKEKFHGSPRFAPRATAASTARAVRNANNRAPQPKLPSKAAPSLPKAGYLPCSATPGPKPLIIFFFAGERVDIIIQKKNPEEEAPQIPQQSESIPEDKEANKFESIENGITVSPTKEANHNEEQRLPAQQRTKEPSEECADDTKEPEKGIEPNNFSGDPEEVRENCSEATANEENNTSENIENSQKADNDKMEDESSAKNSVCSRPQTPKSVHLNVPRSPKAQSRPATPIKPLPKTVPSNNRPNKPNLSSLPRPKTTTALKSCIRPQSQSNNNQLINFNCDSDDISAIFNTKQKEFHRMKKELDLKQQNLLENFNLLQDLRDRMVKEGKSGEGEGLNLQDLVIFNVADWANEEVSQLCRSSNSTAEGAGEIIGTMTPIGDEILLEWNTKVLNLPGNFADVCLQAFTARQEVIDWVKEIIANQEAINEEDLNRITIYNKQGLELCDMLRELKSLADEYLHGVTQLLKQACHEREMLLIVGESLVKEIAHMRQEITLNTAATMEMNALNAAESDTRKALEDTRRELEEEQTAKAVVKDKLATTETQLRQTRIRVNKMDRQLREAEASIASLTMTVKSLEDQSRQKEVQLEARARKLKETLKTGEIANTHIVQQRDVLQTELAQLKEQLQRNAQESKSTVQELNNQIRQLKLTLEAERNTKHEEIEMKLRFEDSFRQSLNTIDELKMQIVEYENSKRNPDLPTETEMELRAELLATKDSLRVAEEEMIACKREKLRFLETLTKITESDNKMAMQQKLAAELVSKEELMSKMQLQIRELTKDIKINEQKVLQYEQYIRDMQTNNMDTINCQESSNGAAYQELQQEILKLRMDLLEAAHKNEELTEILMQKDQELEQQDKTSRAQARVIKVREELINMLKNKETEQSRELSMLQQDLDHRMKIVDEVNKQIAAKAEEIQELFSTLENKQQQIHRLEKIVLALEEQQRRAQAQRTRHEEKIAALEHELAAGGIRRERKFLFF